MKKATKKLGMLLLTIVFACGMLAGCGKGGSGDDSSAAGGKTKLVLWSTYGTYGTQYMSELVEGFNESQDEYFLEVSSGSDASGIRVKMQTSKVENYPSLICGTSTTMASYAKAEYVVPLQQFIDADSEDFTAGMYDAVRNCYSDTDGTLIGHPTGVSFNGYLVNVDVLEETGYTLEDLTSFEKIAEIARTAVGKGLCKYGISFTGGVDLVDMLTMQGADIVDAENGYAGEATKSVLLEGESNAAITKATNLISGLFKDGIALDYGYGSDCAAIFKSNDLLFWKCTNSSTHNIFTSSSSINWAFVPSVGVDESAAYKGYCLSEGTGIFICNTGDEKEMQGAYEFIKYIAQPENQFKFETGIGYVPYTEEAAKIYLDWAKENFPSAPTILDMLKNTPKELGLPFVDVGGEINIALGDLIGDIAADPTGDIASYISEASGAIDNGLKIYAVRNGKGAK